MDVILNKTFVPCFYERMSMLARSSKERADYKDKANRCRDELNYLLENNGEYDL